jgi:hypothetical protein
MLFHFLEQVHGYVNEKVDAGELPQATFTQHDKETKRKISKERIHLDRRKPEKQTESKLWPHPTCHLTIKVELKL